MLHFDLFVNLTHKAFKHSSTFSIFTNHHHFFSVSHQLMIKMFSFWRKSHIF